MSAPNAPKKLLRSRRAKYRISSDSGHPLVSTLLLLTGSEFNALSRLHAKIQMELAEKPNGTRPGRISQSSTMRIGVRYLLERLRDGARSHELFVDACQRLRRDYEADKDPKTKINVYLFREDLLSLLPLQSDLTLRSIRSSRNLVLRCALDFLGAAAQKPRAWSRIIALARELPK